MPEEPFPAETSGDAFDGTLAGALAQAVAERVAEGRADGTYPPEIEAELDAHWRRVAGRPAELSRDRLHRAFDGYVADAGFAVPSPAPSSGAPGGAAIHKLVGKTVSRHMGELVLQLDDFARSVQEMFASIIAVLDDVPTHVHSDLIGQLEAMEGRLAELGRAANRASLVAATPAKTATPGKPATQGKPAGEPIDS